MNGRERRVPFPLKGYKRIGYSCRTQEDSDANSIGMIYDQDEFATVFDADLGKNHQEIIISSPYVSRLRVEAVIEVIDRKGVNDCSIQIITRPAHNYPTEMQDRIALSISRLESLGFTVIQTSELFSKFAIFDQETVWFGDVDFLSKSHEDAYVLRIKNSKVAKELIKRVGL